jgi:hypothetical protein
MAVAKKTKALVTTLNRYILSEADKERSALKNSVGAMASEEPKLTKK